MGARGGRARPVIWPSSSFAIDPVPKGRERFWSEMPCQPRSRTSARAPFEGSASAGHASHESRSLECSPVRTRSKCPIVAARSSEPRRTRLDGHDRRPARRTGFRRPRVSPRPRTSAQRVAVCDAFPGRMPRRRVQLVSPAPTRGAAEPRRRAASCAPGSRRHPAGRAATAPQAASIDGRKPGPSVPEGRRLGRNGFIASQQKVLLS
jgi:hypothetical protein